MPYLRLAFTPSCKKTYAKGKNTADIDHRADTFCWSPAIPIFRTSVAARERGATVYIVGEPKTRSALRNASDQFCEWVGVGAPVPPQLKLGNSAKYALYRVTRSA